MEEYHGVPVSLSEPVPVGQNHIHYEHKTLKGHMQTQLGLCPNTHDSPHEKAKLLTLSKPTCETWHQAYDVDYDVDGAESFLTSCPGICASRHLGVIYHIGNFSVEEMGNPEASSQENPFG